MDIYQTPNFLLWPYHIKQRTHDTESELSMLIIKNIKHVACYLQQCIENTSIIPVTQSVLSQVDCLILCC